MYKIVAGSDRDHSPRRFNRSVSSSASFPSSSGYGSLHASGTTPLSSVQENFVFDSLRASSHEEFPNVFDPTPEPLPPISEEVPSLLLSRQRSYDSSVVAPRSPQMSRQEAKQLLQAFDVHFKEEYLDVVMLPKARLHGRDLTLPNGEVVFLGRTQALSSGSQAQVYKVECWREDGLDARREILVEKVFLPPKREQTLQDIRIMALYEAFCLQILNAKYPDSPFFPKFVGIARNPQGTYSLFQSFIPDATPLGEVLPENITYSLMQSLLTGLDMIHEAGILHGDASKNNVFVCGNGDQAVFIDFGSALVRNVESHYKARFPAGQPGTVGTNSAELIVRSIQPGNLGDHIDHFAVFSSVCNVLSGGKYFSELYGKIPVPDSGGANAAGMYIFRMGRQYPVVYMDQHRADFDALMGLLNHPPARGSDIPRNLLMNGPLDLFFKVLAFPSGAILKDARSERKLPTLCVENTQQLFNQLFPDEVTFNQAREDFVRMLNPLPASPMSTTSSSAQESDA